jgi:hypothetical protein
MASNKGGINIIANNASVSLNNYLGDFSDIDTILALPKVRGNYADYKQLNQSDIQYYYDAGDNVWKARPIDFKGYYSSLQAVKDANENPIPTSLATNNERRSLNYIVFNGEWIEEPTTLNAAFVQATIKNQINYSSLSRVGPDNKIITQIDIEIGNMVLLFQNNLQ